MAATQTVAQRLPLRKCHIPGEAQSLPENAPLPLAARSSVITLFGYGISVRVDRGHLILNDGAGDERRQGRFARVNHGIQRIVVIGSDGDVSLAALRWLADQNAAFVMLERDGSVLAVTGPVAPSDARLRRAQGCVVLSDAAVPIVREIIDHKLTGQEKVARDKLRDSRAADLIAEFRRKLEGAKTVADVRLIEWQGSSAYWPAWRN